MLPVRQAREDTAYLITAQHFGQALVLFGAGDAAVVLPLSALHLLVVELDGIDAHVLLRYRDFLFVYKIEDVFVDVRHFQAVDVASFMVFHKVAEIGTIGFNGRGAVTLLLQQFQIAFRQCVFPFGLGMPHINPAVIDVGVGRIAVVEIRQPESGSRDAGRILACLFRILREQYANSLAVSILYPYVIRTVAFSLYSTMLPLCFRT